MAVKITNFDADESARDNLNSILNKESRLLYAHEVAWLLAISLTTVYELVPRVTTLDSSVRFDPKAIKGLKNCTLIIDQKKSSSLKIEKKNTSVLSKKRKVNFDL